MYALEMAAMSGLLNFFLRNHHRAQLISLKDFPPEGLCTKVGNYNTKVVPKGYQIFEKCYALEKKGKEAVIRKGDTHLLAMQIQICNICP